MQSADRLAEVIGSNAKQSRLDAGLTLDQVSVAAQERGLKWNESRVADFEAGRVAPNLLTLVAVCLALADLGCPNATFPELISAPGEIALNDSQRITSDALRRVIAGRSANVPKPPPPDPKEWGFAGITDPTEQRIARRYRDFDDSVGARHRVILASDSAERRAAKSLGITHALLVVLSAALWQRTISQERDRRADPEANPQKRGQISRQLMSELREAMEAGFGNDQ